MVPIKYKMLQRPNDGFDENDRWNGMSLAEYEVWRKRVWRELEQLHRQWRLRNALEDLRRLGSGTVH